MSPATSGLARRALPLAALALWLLGLVHVLVAPWAPLSRLELAWSDARQALATPAAASPRTDLLIVDIDDASLRSTGRWPWPRARLAQLLDRLFEGAAPAAVGIDLLMAEPDTPQDDAALARALRGRPVVLAWHFNQDAAAGSAQAASAPTLPGALYDWPVHPGQDDPLRRWPRVVPPTAALLDAAAGTGFINALPDADGALRVAALVGADAQAAYPSFALAVWRQWQGAALVRPVIAHGPGTTQRLQALRLSDAQGRALPPLPVDASGAVPVPWQGLAGSGAAGARAGNPGSGRIRFVPAAQVLAGGLPPAERAGRVVLIGSSAPGLTDLRVTPLGALLPGIEVHAQLLAGMADGRLPLRPDAAPALSLLVLAVALALAQALLRRLPGPRAMLALLLLAAGLLLLDVAALRLRGQLLPLLLPFLGVLLLGAGSLATAYLHGWHSLRSLTRLFGQYLPPERVREMARDPATFLALADRAENRELSVLFCDLRGFTRVSEQMPPEQLRVWLNAYFSAVSELVHEHGGTLDKYIGDAVMAFWGAPLPEPDHARRAVEAACAIRAMLPALNARLAAQGLPPVDPQVGVATGVVCVGDLGAARRRSYTAVGDAVNLAARIEAMTRQFGEPVLVAESTVRAVQARQADGSVAGPALHWRAVAEAPVKGRQQGVQLFAPVPYTPSTPAPG